MFRDIDTARFFLVRFFDKHFPTDRVSHQFSIGRNGQFTTTRALGLHLTRVKTVVGGDLHIDFGAIALARLHKVQVHVLFKNDRRPVRRNAEMADGFIFKSSQLFRATLGLTIFIDVDAVQVVSARGGTQEVQSAVVAPTRQDVVGVKQR